MKTSLAKHLYVFNVLDLMLEESKFKNLKYKCIWFGLEESLEEFQCSVLQYALSKYYEVYVTQDELLSRINPLRDEVERLIESEKVKNYYQKCFEIVDFQDSISNPTGIFKHCRDYSNQIGVHHYKNIEIDKEDVSVYSNYVQNDKELIVAVVIDNVNILAPEKNHLGTTLNLDGSIDLLVNHYMRKQVTKHWKWHVCCLQQQQMAGGDINHMKMDMLEPSPQKLGDNIKVARSYQIIIGLHSPYKHKKATYLGYQILNKEGTPGLEDCYRSLHLLKNRFGRTGTVESLFFNPKGFFFKSLPQFNDISFQDIIKLKQNVLA